MARVLTQYPITITALKPDLQEMPLIVDILKIYNPRICEILRLKKSNIKSKNLICLPGAKKSQDVVIRDRDLVKRLLTLSEARTDEIFIHTNYKRVYDYVRKYFSHLSNGIESKQNRKVTHLFRYLAVNGDYNGDSIKSILHHNSKKSNSYYTNKVKGHKNGTYS